MYRSVYVCVCMTLYHVQHIVVHWNLKNNSLHFSPSGRRGLHYEDLLLGLIKIHVNLLDCGFDLLWKLCDTKPDTNTWRSNVNISFWTNTDSLTVLFHLVDFHSHPPTPIPQRPTNTTQKMNHPNVTCCNSNRMLSHYAIPGMRYRDVGTTRRLGFYLPLQYAISWDWLGLINCSLPYQGP